MISRCQSMIFGTILSLLLLSCDGTASKLVSSGSSDFGFINYFIVPLTDSVIAVGDGVKTFALNPLAARSSNAITSQTEFSAATQRADTVKSSINTNYCGFFAADFKEKSPTKRYYQDPSKKLAVIAPLIAERSYLTLMRIYCYSKEAFYLSDTRVINENNAQYGKVRWYKNQSTNLGSNTDLAFLISQSQKDNTTQILSVFKENNDSTPDRLYGKLHFTQKPNNEKQLHLIRYFVDNDTKTYAIPERLRQEGYAMSTTRDDKGTVHHITTFVLNYVANSAGSIGGDEPNGLLIHTSQFVVHSNWGSKLVKARYCWFDGRNSTRDKRILSINENTYNCDATNAIQINPNPTEKIDNSDKTGDSVSTGYYDVSGNLLVKHSRGYPSDKTQAIDALDKVVDLALLKELSKKISPPLTLGKDISGDTLNNDIFDTENHLKFK